MKRTDTERRPRWRPRRRPRAWVAVAGVASVLALFACDPPSEIDPRDRLCGRLVRFHLGMHHPVEVTSSDHVPGTQNVRIAYRGTRRESSLEGIALCRLSDESGSLRVLGAFVDGERLEDQGVQAFNRFVQTRQHFGR